jgi:hypothetical protein
MTAPQSNDQFSISVEMADGFEPSARLAAALDELVAAIGDEMATDEVTGFQLGYQVGGSGSNTRSFGFGLNATNEWYSQPPVLEKVKTVRT